MKKIGKIFEYGYLLIAVVFLVETFVNWNVDRKKAYMQLIFAGVATFMYFFRRRFRKKSENGNK